MSFPAWAQRVPSGVGRAFGSPAPRRGALVRVAQALARLGAAFGLAAIAAAYALDPAHDLNQYNWRTWTRENGLPVNGITTVTQSGDGFVWLGSSKGILRFDGLDFQLVPVPSSPLVRSLLPAAHGGLWVALDLAGIRRFDGTTFTSISAKSWGDVHSGVRQLMQGRNGEVWAATAGGVVRLGRVDGSYERLPGVPPGEDANAFGVSEDSFGRIWVATLGHGVFYWQNGQVRKLPDPRLDQLICHRVAVQPDGSIWVATTVGVFGYDEHLQPTQILASAEEVRALVVDRAGALWIGGTHGVFRYFHGALQTKGPREGLFVDGITALYEDRDGSMWVGGRDGLACVTDVKFPTQAAAQSGVTEEVFGVGASRQGGVWVAHANGLSYHDPHGAVTTYGPEAGLASTIYKRVFEARDRTVYAVEGASTLVVLTDGKVRARYHAPNLIVGMAEDARGVVVSVGGDLFRASPAGLQPYAWTAGAPPMYWILDLLTSRDGALWVSSVNGVFRIKDGAVRHWGSEEGLTGPGAFMVAEDAEGVMWVTTLSGLGRLDGDRVRLIRQSDGLFDENLWAAVPDDRGGLWVDSMSGLYWLNRRALADFAAGRTPRVESVRYDGTNAVRPADKQHQERIAVRSADGRIWFPSANGVLVVDPAHVPPNPVPAPAVVDRVVANGVEFAPAAVAVVPPGRGELSFRFTAPIFIAPERARFRYRLFGYDPDWVEAGTHRFAVYNNLPPGRYTFEVEAATADGVRAPAGARIAVELRPFAYQTLWFRLLGAGLGVAAVGGLFGARVRRLRRKAIELQENRVRLESEVTQRTAQLAQTNAVLQREVEERRRAEVELVQRTQALEREIAENKRMQSEVERVNRKLLDVSRQAGMAEVATGVLHNVGNVLNSVNVSAALAIEHVQRSKLASVAKLGTLLQEHAADLTAFLTRDPRGQRVPVYVDTLGRQLASEQSAILAELESLRKNVSHINDIVAMQQSFATAAGVVEQLPIRDLVEDAIRINASAIERHGLTLTRDFQASPVLPVERHKVMQILINVIRNAKYACDDSGRSDKRITIRITADLAWARVAVIDNGVGIPAENLTRIFGHGFTTRKTGHGFGLHSSGNAAKELGGSLVAESAGRGQGATFTLVLPLGRPGRS